MVADDKKETATDTLARLRSEAAEESQGKKEKTDQGIVVSTLTLDSGQEVPVREIDGKVYYETTVDGKKTLTSAQDLLVNFQKGKSGDARLREAAEKHKAVTEERDKTLEASRTTAKILDDLKLANGGDVEAIRRMRSYNSQYGLGYSDAAFDEAEKDALGPPNGRQAQGRKTTLGMEDLDDELKESFGLLKDLGEERNQRLMDHGKGQVQEALEKDDVLAYAFKRRPGFKARVVDFAWEVAQRRARETKNWGLGLAGAIEDAQGYVKDAGLLDDLGQQTKGAEGAPMLGKSLSSSLSSLHRSQERPGPPETTRDTATHVKSIMERVAYAQAHEKD